MDDHRNFVYTTVVTAPSPAASGTALVIDDAVLPAVMPAVPFNVVVWPDGERPVESNAEVVRVTSLGTGDDWTIVREQSGSDPRTIVTGDQVALAVEHLWMRQVEAAPRLRYTYDDSSVVDSDPGPGLMRFSDADPGSSSYVFIDNLDADGVDRSNDILFWGVADGEPVGIQFRRGYLKIIDAADPNTFVFGTAQTVETDTGYMRILISPAMVGTLTAGDVLLEFDHAPEAPWANRVVHEGSTEDHGFAEGDVIRRVSDSTFALAQADSAANAEVIGIVSRVVDTEFFHYVSHGYAEGLDSLVDGSVYFLDPTTPGALTATEPTADGQVSKPLLIALSDEAGIFFNMRGYVVGASDAVAVPTVVSVGAEFSGTGVPTATLPGTHAADDILLLILQSSNDAAVTPPAGYARLGPQNGIGAAAAAGSTKMSIFWKRDGGSESAPTIPDTGDHTYGVMLAVRGCPTTGDPFHLLGNTFKFTTSTAASGPQGAGTVIDNCLILDIFGHGVDDAGAQASSVANADLSAVTEEFDNGTTDGTGGGIVVISGTKAIAGPLGPTTFTWAATTVEVSTRIAFIPAAMVGSALKPTQVQVFIGSAVDLDDVWTKPSGAKKVLAQICDGGGGGSGGRAAAVAAGGGGGGGGGYDEAWFNANELAATITVHAGRGGTAGAADGAGTQGVLSEFNKGGIGPLAAAWMRVAGTAPTAAITADGGNGGCGSGRGTSSPAVVTTRRTLNDANAARASGGGGAPGGSGTTAPVGGSEADWGGGGGSSGADTDATQDPWNNGSSVRGAGGGGGGRTNTNVGRGGYGGGATSVSSTQGAAGTDSVLLPFGGSGGNGGGSSVATGGPGGFPGGGGGGGGTTTGGRGGHGCVVVTTYF